MVALIKTAQLILSLSLLVVFHEFGHFLWSKLFKTRVDKFYMFFNPKFWLFRAKRVLSHPDSAARPFRDFDPVRWQVILLWWSIVIYN